MTTATAPGPLDREWARVADGLRELGTSEPAIVAFEAMFQAGAAAAVRILLVADVEPCAATLKLLDVLHGDLAAYAERHAPEGL